jgi:hypothetical protein
MSDHSRDEFMSVVIDSAGASSPYYKAPRSAANNTAPEPDPKVIADSLVEIHRKATARDITRLSSLRLELVPPTIRPPGKPRPEAVATYLLGSEPRGQFLLTLHKN